MFRDAKIGDKVLHKYYRHGIIVNINEDHLYPVRVDFTACNCSITFMVDGREFVDQKKIKLHWEA